MMRRSGVASLDSGLGPQNRLLRFGCPQRQFGCARRSHGVGRATRGELPFPIGGFDKIPSLGIEHSQGMLDGGFRWRQCGGPLGCIAGLLPLSAVQIGLGQGGPHQGVVRLETGRVFEAAPGLGQFIGLQRQQAPAEFRFEGFLGCRHG